MSVGPILRRNQDRAMPGAPQNGGNAGRSREPLAGIAACDAASDASLGSRRSAGCSQPCLLVRKPRLFAAPLAVCFSAQYTGLKSGLTMRMAPNVECASQGLVLSSFIARIHEAGTRPGTAAEETDRETHVALKYALAPPTDRPNSTNPGQAGHRNSSCRHDELRLRQLFSGAVWFSMSPWHNHHLPNLSRRMHNTE
jgi:hypothetical protein